MQRKKSDVRMERRRMEQQTRQRGDKANQARQAKEKIKNRSEIIQSLRECEATFCQWIVTKEHLNTTHGPTFALFQVSFECLRHKAGRQYAIEIAGFISLCVQIHAGVNVFSDGLCLEASNFLKRFAAEKAATTGEESAVVRVS